ncbi:hypothetical protein AWP74_15860 [Escherichia coli]|nr:hypothetical protein BUQ71_11490 [Escherichia coli]OKU54610.1 hypothetical protein ACN82_12600 [Escherichia coli]OKW30617.1 hypothetical protein AWP74_15860 [Escherichia coli]OOH69969.1 hypothetical protein BMU01_13100 [Escherichia coli]QRF38655.1 hypothetical protein BWZ24_24040 [Escherichia coli]
MLRAAPFVPLTLTLSPKGRGDRLCTVLSPVLHHCRMRRERLIRPTQSTELVGMIRRGKRRIRLQRTTAGCGASALSGLRIGIRHSNPQYPIFFFFSNSSFAVSGR